MKRLVFCLACFSLIFLQGCDYTPRPLPPIEVFFSPEGGCTEAVVRELDAAQSSVLVQAYSFTSRPIAQALAAARRRGVHVEVIIDRKEIDKFSQAGFLHHAGVPVCLDGRHAIAHNKVIVIDGKTVITGSFNFTKQAEERNAENLLVIRDIVLAEKYAANWKQHAEHSEEYTGSEE